MRDKSGEIFVGMMDWNLVGSSGRVLEIVFGWNYLAVALVIVLYCPAFSLGFSPQCIASVPALPLH